MQNLIVVLIIALAGFFVARRFYRSSKRQGDCGYGCSSCETSPADCLPENRDSARCEQQTISANR